ncbi:hypothetical protein [Mesorhizobium sp. M0768]|uniref:hypothetical protein n=1 Tax=Mesorhizobium sp. M0768 TaxID=2956996 RepID=UPI0033366FAE
MKKWEREIGSQAGLDDLKFQIMTGSIDAGSDGRVTSPGRKPRQLEAFFARIGKIAAHAKWGKEMEPYVVSGTSLWNIYRIVE